MDKKSVLDPQFIHPTAPQTTNQQNVPQQATAYPYMQAAQQQQYSMQPAVQYQPQQQQQQFQQYSMQPAVQYQQQQQFQQYPVIVPATTQYPQPQPVPIIKDSCCNRNQKYKPQSNSVGPAVLIITTGGMNIAWSNGFNALAITWTYFQICWFIGAIIGVSLAAALVNKLSKKIFMLVSSLLVLLGGILVLSCPTNSTAIIMARHINGLAVGFVLVPSLIMCGEESVKERRGMLAGTLESLSFSFGAFLQMLYFRLWTYSTNGFGSTQIHGLLCIIFGALSLIFVFIFVIESPVHLLLRNQELEAIESLRRLQYPGVVTTETYEQFNEHKHYIAVNKELSLGQSFGNSMPALLKLCFYRGIVAMSFSYFVSLSFATGLILSQFSFNSWPFIVLAFLRWFGSSVGITIIDSTGRKKPLMFSMLLCAAMAIGVGVIYTDIYAYLYQDYTVIILLFIFQFFAGLAATSSSAYLSEGFPMAVKPFCIAIVLVFEMLVQIIMLACSSLDGISDFFIVLGCFSLLFVGLTYLCLPETKNLTLREAQAKFKSFLSTGF